MRRGLTAGVLSKLWNPCRKVLLTVLAYLSTPEVTPSQEKLHPEGDLHCKHGISSKGPCLLHLMLTSDWASEMHWSLKLQAL